jgi:hypothetical protein
MEIKAPSLMYPEDQKQLAAMLRSGGTVTVHPSPPQDASLLRDFLASTASAWLRGHWSGPFANAPVATLGPRFQQALAEQAPSIPPAQQLGGSGNVSSFECKQFVEDVQHHATAVLALHV